MNWINPGEIAKIAGALKATAYVARAYRHAQEHGGQMPAWARKLDNGRWQFTADYIREDAATLGKTLSVVEAAKMVGVTRRTMQAWIDRDVVPILKAGRQHGETRQILKEQFVRLMPNLMKRLETPAVIGYRTKHGQPVPQQALERLAAEKTARESAVVKRRARRRQEQLGPAADLTAEQIGARIESLSSLRTRTARESSLAAREASRTRAEEERLRNVFARAQAELRAARRALRDASLARREAARNRDRKAAEERRVSAEEAGLKNAVQKTKREARQKEVAELEAQLRAARDAQKKEAAREQKVVSVAQKIADDMFDGKIARADALTIFNKAADALSTPQEMRDRVRKKILGR